MTETCTETKVCSGPTHPAPVELPLTPEHWYFHRVGEKAGRPMSRCKVCCLAARGVRMDIQHGFVPASKQIQRYAQELIGRMGNQEAMRFSGISDTTLRAMQNLSHPRFRKQQVALLLVAVRRARREGIMRHRNSIKHGATVRKPMKVKGWKRKNDGAVIPDHTRQPGQDRTALKIEDQNGTIYPNLETELLAEEARKAIESKRKLTEAQRRALAEQEEREDRATRLAGY